MDGPAPDRPRRMARSDPKSLAELVGQKMKADVDPADPIFLVAAICEELQKRAVAELGELVTGQADQIAAGAVMAENSAKAKSEAIITQGAEFAARRITAAGDAVSAKLREETERAEAASAVLAVRLKWATIVAVVCAVAALAATAATITAILF